MSFDFVVVAARNNVPTPTEWQRAIDHAGFPVKIDTQFDVDTFTGFLPCTFRNAESGFEYFSQSDAESGPDGPAPGRDFTIILTAQGDDDVGATAVLAAAALCHACRGVLTDPQSGESIPASACIEWARNWLAHLEASVSAAPGATSRIAEATAVRTFGLRTEVARIVGKRVVHAMIIGVLSPAALNAGFVRGPWLWVIATLLAMGFGICLYRAYRAARMPFEMTLRGNGGLAWRSALGHGALPISALRRIATSTWDHGTLDVEAVGASLPLPADFAAKRDLWAALRAAHPGLRIDAP